MEEKEKQRLALNRYRKRRYERLRAEGICIAFNCGRPSKGMVYCDRHRVYMNELRAKKRREKEDE